MHIVHYWIDAYDPAGAIWRQRKVSEIKHFRDPIAVVAVQGNTPEKREWLTVEVGTSGHGDFPPGPRQREPQMVGPPFKGQPPWPSARW